ncbi:hypothetical protein LEN26_018834 [Aphanomyces euteiches]|nr:hypothetical protein LEN26_018834 [Aphanomyces euteiches]KAH9104971.1 hypothetical protein AeMF1_019094 [Aphanomyces euteiches]KAH9194174.1 hypothetical protein AeNC1_003851 [Aphanomyces euteiches]
MFTTRSARATEKRRVIDHGMTSLDAAEAWLYRLLHHYGFSKQELVRRLRGPHTRASRVPMDYLRKVVHELEPDTLRHPFNTSLVSFWQEFAVDDTHVDVEAAVESLWPKDESRGTSPRHTLRSPSARYASPPNQLGSTLGPLHMAKLEATLSSMSTRLRIPDLFELISVVAPQWDMAADDFYSLCQPFCDSDGFVNTRSFVREIQTAPPMEDATRRLQDALKHISSDDLVEQCAMFDMEDDGWISISECVSVFHALPDVDLTPVEIEQGLLPLAQPDKRIAYVDVCTILGQQAITDKNDQWHAMRCELCNDDPHIGHQVFDQLSRIFQKLSTHPSRCMISAGHLERVLGSLLTARELQWIQETLGKSNGLVDGHELLEQLFPRSFLETCGRSLERPHEQPFESPRPRAITPRGRQTTPLDIPAFDRKYHSASPTKAQTTTRRLAKNLSIDTTRSPSSKSTPKNDESLFQRLRELIVYHEINLLVLNDVSDAAGHIPLAAACDVLWRHVEAYKTITYVQLQRLLGRFATKNKAKLQLSSLLDGLFDWTRLRSVTHHSLEELLDTFELFATTHPGYLRWYPEFQQSLTEMFDVQLMAWEQQVLCHRFGVTMHHEMWINYAAFVKHLAHMPQSLWALVSAHCDFQEMDPTHKGYVDRADLKRFLQRILNHTPTAQQVGQVWHEFLRDDPTATVSHQEAARGCSGKEVDENAILRMQQVDSSLNDGLILSLFQALDAVECFNGQWRL